MWRRRESSHRHRVSNWRDQCWENGREILHLLGANTLCEGWKVCVSGKFAVFASVHSGHHSIHSWSVIPRLKNENRFRQVLWISLWSIRGYRVVGFGFSWVCFYTLPDILNHNIFIKTMKSIRFKFWTGEILWFKALLGGRLSAKNLAYFSNRYAYTRAKYSCGRRMLASASVLRLTR